MMGLNFIKCKREGLHLSKHSAIYASRHSQQQSHGNEVIGMNNFGSSAFGNHYVVMLHSKHIQNLVAVH